MTQTVFARSEKKYLISYAQVDALVAALGDSLALSAYSNTYIRNLYLDTPERLLIRRSIEKPLYKEKLRVRTYGGSKQAFFELKKKFNGQVYKRRATMDLLDACAFIKRAGQIGELDSKQVGEPSDKRAGGQADGQTDDPLRKQILRELAWAVEQYAPLEPFMNINYERCAYDLGDVRITIDCDVAWTSGSWAGFALEKGDPRLIQLLPPQTCIMEIKALDGLPLKLTRLLSDLKIFPSSFSKVGKAYEAALEATGESQWIEASGELCGQSTITPTEDDICTTVGASCARPLSSQNISACQTNVSFPHKTAQTQRALTAA